jgi:hypothetical protein
MNWKGLYGIGRGRAIVQAVSRRLPTAAARVRPCGICGGHSGTGVGFFFRVLRFPLPIRIPPIPEQSIIIIWGWYNRSNSGRSTKWTQSHPMKEGKKGIELGPMEFYSWHLRGGTEENHENLGQGSRYPDRNLNRAREYECGVLLPLEPSP